MAHDAPWILGLAASHNGAACLMRGDQPVVAIQEERLSRSKRARLDPADFLALDYCLDAAEVRVDDLDLVVVCPLRSAAGAERALAAHPRLARRPRTTVTHHRAHALSAFTLSGFEDAAVLVVDGMGSVATDLSDLAPSPDPDAREIITIFDATDRGLRRVHTQLASAAAPSVDVTDLRPRMMPFTSLGVMYQAVAQQIFGGWFDAGKVMGLAPYGRRRWPTGAFLTIEGDATVTFHDGVSAHFRHRARWPTHDADYRDLAASTQAALEDAMRALAARARDLTGRKRLCLAGGVALNSVANERIIRDGHFDDVFVVPAAEDAGTAVGAAIHGRASLGGAITGAPIAADSMGRQYTAEDVALALDTVDLPPGATARREPALAEEVADLLVAGHVVGWFEGGSELGPRALGHRSLLCDPRRGDAKERMNARVKHREAFRPFAPAVLAEHAQAWFDLGDRQPASPFMLRVCPVRAARRDQIPAVVHVDGTARLQTVHRGPFHALIAAFARRTGVPVLLNTSFNVAGEPIVESPADALRCFSLTDIDALAIEGWLICKAAVGVDQP